MDLTRAQYQSLSSLVKEWSADRRIELEATFGERGVVDSMTFLQIAQRIRTKGFEEIPHDDYLNIITPNQVRFTLQGLGIIQAYCKDDKLDDKSFTAMIKSRARQDSTLDLHEYDIRVKTRREDPLSEDDPSIASMLAKWDGQQKAFRLIRRWSFKGNGVRVDLSMVRQTPFDSATHQFQWSTSFLQRSVLREPPRYEVEVELEHGNAKGDDVTTAIKTLIATAGEIARAMQKNTLLIRKSVAASVRAEYEALVGTSKFRGVKPVTLELEHFTAGSITEPSNVRSGYNVTDKADGLRALGFVNKVGEVYFLDQNLNVYRTDLVNPACASSIVDGEWVTLSKHKEARNDYLLFDVYMLYGKKVSHLPFYATDAETGKPIAECRHSLMEAWYQEWTSIEPKLFQLYLKTFAFGQEGDSSIFLRGCSSILDTARIYHTDGLILTRNAEPLPDAADVRFDYQYKWKPAKDNTVDFLVKYEKDLEIPTMDKLSRTIDASSNSTVEYKTMRLYVGSANDATSVNPRSVVLDQLPLPTEAKKGNYQPALFTPTDFPDTHANTCHVRVTMNHDTGEEYAMTEDTEEPIADGSIVEMRYEPSREPGWRWVPSRIRYDKTERLMKAVRAARGKASAIRYSGMMNDEKVANSVWNSIHEPITLSMIRTGAEAPNEAERAALLAASVSAEESKTYYVRTAPRENFALISGLRDFHNRYIKNEILLKRALMGGRTRLLDVACGKGGDLSKWANLGATHVLGVDSAGENITDPADGAYKRYVKLLMSSRGKKAVPQIAFVMGNSSKPLVSGEAGITAQEADILRSVFGRADVEGSVPSFIDKTMAGTFRDGADVVACMFALHYFFESTTTLDGFLANLAETTKPGGVFVGCCFDGERVHDLLRAVDKGRSVVGTEGDATIWTITKQYDASQLSAEDDSVGLAVDVEFVSIGSTHREYLVSFPYLQERLRAIGFRLLNAKELAEMGLTASTNLFDTSYEMMMRKGAASSEKNRYFMSDTVREFSFLNRWFIFKREGLDAPPPIELAVAAEAAEAVEAAEAAAAPAPAAQAWDVPPAATKQFKKEEVFLFGLDAEESPVLLGDKFAGRWLGLGAPFPIPDPEDPSVVYPTGEHFLAGMRLQHASNQPDLARTLMSVQGKIHQDMAHVRLKETIAEESPRDFALLQREMKAVRESMDRGALTARGVTINEAAAVGRRDDDILYVLGYRFRRDKRFHNLVEEARKQKKYMLYMSKAEANAGGVPELSGVRHGVKKTITGSNKVGRLLMRVGGF